MCNKLEFVETHDLVRELLSRSTFAGLVLFSPEEHRYDNQIHQEFHLLTTTSVEETELLLLRALDSVRSSSQQ